MKMNKIFMGILAATMLLFAGCSVGTDNAEKEGISFGGGSSSSGNSGVELSYTKGNPPSEMIKDTPYTFGFVFKNYQKHGISDLQVQTKGFDRGYVSGLSKKYNVQTIPKATDQAGPGVYSGLTVEGVRVTGFQGNYNFNPEFDYCYSAKTSFRKQLCVPSKDNQCNTQVESSMTQNGPVSIKIDRVTPTGNNVRMDFTLQNKGNGEVKNSCFASDEYARSYSLDTAKLGSSQGNCEAVSGYKLINGKASFHCNFPRTSEDSYASQVILELSYKYQQSTKKNIVVEDLNQQ